MKTIRLLHLIFQDKLPMTSAIATDPLRSYQMKSRLISFWGCLLKFNFNMLQAKTHSPRRK